MFLTSGGMHFIFGIFGKGGGLILEKSCLSVHAVGPIASLSHEASVLTKHCVHRPSRFAFVSQDKLFYIYVSIIQFTQINNKYNQIMEEYNKRKPTK